MDFLRATRGKFVSEASTIMETMNSRAICSIVPNVDIKAFFLEDFDLQPNKSTSECPQQLPHKLEFRSN